MAGVYIKGAKLPDACWDCGWDTCDLWNYDRGDAPKHPHCPLVEVPDHGDLIDRDALRIIWGRTNGKMFFSKSLKDAPVVIPAEKAKNDLEIVE